MEIKKEEYYKEQYDLHNCNKEPIHRIRRAQEYGSLICCNIKGSEWYHASEDIVDELLATSISSYLAKSTGVEFAEIIPNQEIQFISNIGFTKSLLIHSTSFGYILEIEPTTSNAPLNTNTEAYNGVILNLSKAISQQNLLDEIVEQVYKLTRYDHIMIYRFEEDYSGEVIAERKTNDGQSYLGLKFPSTDIPEQARNLYFKEKVRIINNASKDGHVIKHNPATEYMEIDLSGVSMRGVSPIHREYLSNMGVVASFSVAIIEEDRLWGLIACHNHTPSFINYNTRAWLRFLSEFISLNKNKITLNDINIKKAQDTIVRSQIMENIQTSKDLISSLLDGKDSVRKLISSNGLIIKSGEKIKGIGDIPEEEYLDKLSEWLDSLDNFDVKFSSRISELLPPELQHKLLTGILIIQLSSISGDYIIWTKKGKSTEVEWAGNPSTNKRYDDLKGRMTPRKSFELYKQKVHDRTEPWDDKEIALAISFKFELRENLYKKYNEAVLLNKELKEAYNQLETFSYSVSHDLKAPLRSIEGFAHILKEDYSDQLDEHGIYLLEIIIQSISTMNVFIKQILNYSKLNKNNLDVMKINLNSVILQQWSVLSSNSEISPVLHFDENIPDVYGDLHMINQVILNLLSNSIKYVTKGTKPEIKITFEHKENYINVILEDNGIGIPEDQRERVFEVFRRLVRSDDYEGTGVGLSIVKRVIERHSGTIKIKDSKISPTGSRFEFSLPSSPEFVERLNERLTDRKI